MLAALLLQRVLIKVTEKTVLAFKACDYPEKHGSLAAGPRQKSLRG
jgi:hypothetical protein